VVASNQGIHAICAIQLTIYAITLTML